MRFVALLCDDCVNFLGDAAHDGQLTTDAYLKQWLLFTLFLNKTELYPLPTDV